VTLPRQWQRHALALVEQASPLDGEFFRSVELSYAHPDDLVSGEGTRSHGGRFVRPGLRAVYGSIDEETAFRESAARANRLAGRGGARVVGYPRITYVIGVKAANHVALTTTDPDAAAILPACLDPNDLTDSQAVGEFLHTHNVQALAFPSAIPGFSGRNLVVFRDVVPGPVIVLVNREQIMKELRQLARRVEQ
jgi:RES domain-containing protein